MERHETAELVGYYFGLQRAGNMRISVDRQDEAYGAGIAVNKLRQQIDTEMASIAARLPPGTIETWPNRVTV